MFDWITGFLEDSGYAGIVFLMALENIFPPIPSELIMPMAGFKAAQGDMNIVLVILAGSLGSVLGGLPWYYLGYFFGLKRMKALSARFGRLMTVSPKDIQYASDWFDRYGVYAVFFGRLVPTVRTLISVPAGLASMKLPVFLAYTTAGTIIWTTFLAMLGYILENRYEQVEDYVNPVSTAVVIGVVAIYLYRVITWKTPTEHQN